MLVIPSTCTILVTLAVPKATIGLTSILAAGDAPAKAATVRGFPVPATATTATQTRVARPLILEEAERHTVGRRCT